MVWWIWVLIGFLLLGIEMMSTTLHVAFFAFGAFVVALLVGLHAGGPLWVQLLVFTVSSLIALLLLRPIVVRKLKLSETKVVDTLVGETAVAMTRIPIAGIGKAEMRGSSWSARNVGANEIESGQRCVVDHIEGLTIHIRGD